MRLTVGTQLSQGPDTLATAALDALATSVGGLLQILETHLGLTAPRPSESERVAALIPRLRATPGPYSASLQADPWTTARRVLRDHAALTLEGWAGQPISARWEPLWTVTRGLSPSPGERWHAVTAALNGRPPLPLETLTLVDARHTFAGAVQRAFAALEAIGVELREADPPSVEQHGDLARAQTSAFLPEGDGSLVLVRAPGPLEGADDLASWIATHRSRSDEAITVLGADAMLDEALRRHGLPGAATPRPTDALALLPLALTFLAEVPDPTPALEFLLLQPNPLPASLRFELAAALRRTPAVGSDRWCRALQRWNDDATDANRSAASTLLNTAHVQPGAPWPKAELTARARALAQWARGRQHGKNDADASCVAVQCQRFVALLDQTDTPTVSAAWAQRLITAATEDAGAPRSQAEAGLGFVAYPGGVITPTDTLVWWNFTRDAAALPPSVPLTLAERDALGRHGVSPRTAQDRARAAAVQWWRPLLHARRRVLLVAPRSNSPGVVLHPHPLWSELIARIPREQRDARAPRLEARLPGALARVETTPLPRPIAAARWRLSAPPPRREKDSPSSLATLVGCSFRYTLKYAANVDDAASFSLDLAGRDMGTLAHAVLADVLGQAPHDPDRAASLAADAFERLGPRSVAALFQPGQATARDQTRGQVVESARALSTWLRDEGLHVVRLEETIGCAWDGQTLEGRADLIAGDDTRTVVLDHKLGGRSGRDGDLRHGTAVQLAAYAFILEQGGEPNPAIGYFIVRDQTLLGIAGGPFPASAAVEGPAVREVWPAFEAAARARWQQLQEGTALAPAVDPSPPRTRLRDGVFEQEPPCGFCSFDALCGRSFEEGA